MDLWCSPPCRRRDLVAPPGCGSDGGSCPPGRHHAIYKVPTKIGEIPPKKWLRRCTEDAESERTCREEQWEFACWARVPPHPLCIFPGDAAGSRSIPCGRSIGMRRGRTSAGTSSPSPPQRRRLQAQDALSHGKAICPPNFGSGARPPQPPAARSKREAPGWVQPPQSQVFIVIFSSSLIKQRANWLFFLGGGRAFLPRGLEDP